MSLGNVKSYIGPHVPNWMKFGRCYHNAIRDIYKFHALSDSRKKDYIQCQVLNAVCQAYDKTVFYNELYRSININPHRFKTLSDLNYLPIVTRKDIIDNIDDLIFNYIDKDDLLRANTGGSTGSPLPLYRSRYEVAQEFAYLDYHLAKLFGGYSWLNKKKIILRGNTNKGDVITKLGSNLIVSSQLLNEENISLVVGEIIKFNPDLIHAYPSSLMKLLDLLLLNKSNISIPYMLTSSEVITQQQINLATNVLNTQYLDLYGNSEHSVLALNIQSQYEFDMSYCYPEFIKGKIVSTKLIKSPMPLIRYDCGDTYLDANILTDNFTEKVLKSIGGRVVEYVSDSSKNKLPVVSLIYGQHYRFFDSVNDFSLVQVKPGVLVIEYIATKPLCESDVYDAQQIINKITKQLLTVSFVRVKSMRMNKNGKKAFLVKVTV